MHGGKYGLFHSDFGVRGLRHDAHFEPSGKTQCHFARDDRGTPAGAPGDRALAVAHGHPDWRGSGVFGRHGLELSATVSNAVEGGYLADARRIAGLFRRLWSFPKVLIAAVQGPAVAGGTGLATLAD